MILKCDLRELNPTANQIYLSCVAYLIEKTKNPDLFYFLQYASFMKCKRDGSFFKFEIQRGVVRNKEYIKPNITMSKQFITYLMPQSICKYEQKGLYSVRTGPRGIPKEIWEYLVKWCIKTS